MMIRVFLYNFSEYAIIQIFIAGFAFSDGSVRPGCTPMQISILMKNLMKNLGHEKYYVQGGDWGGHIVQLLATLFPQHVIGLHSNFCFVNTPLAHVKVFLGGFFPSLIIDDKISDRVYPMKDKFGYLLKESGYMHIQATKPDTLGEFRQKHILSLQMNDVQFSKLISLYFHA